MELATGNIVEDLTRWSNYFMDHCRAKGMAKRSITIYGGILNELVEFSRPYQDQTSIRDANQFFITTFFNEKGNAEASKLVKNPTGKHGFGTSSKNLFLSVIKKFFLYVSENNLDSLDLTQSLRKFKIKREIKLKPRIEENEITRLLNYIEKQKTEGKRVLTTYRNALIFKTFLYTGIRAEELVQLRYSDLVFDETIDDYTIKVKGKGGKERLVYLSRDMVEDELDFLLVRHQPSDFIAISTKSGEALAPKRVYELLDRMYRGACVNKRGIHILRHTLARRLVDRNVNLETIRDILGHSSIGITSDFYAKTNEKNKRAALVDPHARPVKQSISQQ
jgi:integrase/recombinase XerD